MATVSYHEMNLKVKRPRLVSMDAAAPGHVDFSPGDTISATATSKTVKDAMEAAMDLSLSTAESARRVLEIFAASGWSEPDLGTIAHA